MKPSLIAYFTLAAIGVQAQTLTLPEAVAQARSSRASVQAARIKLEQARLARRALGAAPTTSLLVGYTNDLRVGGSDEDLVLSQPVDLFGRTSAMRRTGDALVLQAEANLRQTELDLQSDVVTLYVEGVAATSRLAIARDAEEAAARLLEAVKGLVEGGKLPGVQATRVSIELERAHATRKHREAELAAARRRLLAAIGDGGGVTADAFPDLPVAEVSVAELISWRADLLTLSAEISAAEADARVARTSRLPQLELQGRRSPWQESDPTYGGRIQLTFPLFDYGKSRAEEGAASKRAEAARKAMADAQRIARGEIDAAKLEVAGAVEQVKSLEMVVATSRDLVSRTQTGLREGANTLIDVLDAARALREIEESLVEARVTLATAQARYLRATGSLIEVKQ